MSPHLASALGAFRLIVKDFGFLLEYVHPCDANAQTFSHRTFELLLRCCTEFEALAKHGAVEQGLIAADRQPHIGDLSGLFESLELKNTDVGLLPWQPVPKYVAPLVGWSSRPHGLGWYRAYNEVKHNRSASFEKATLENVGLALTACFQLLQRFGALPLNSSIYRVDQESFKIEWHFNGVPLTFRAPAVWPPHLRGESAA